eukprot:40436-Eustigmatos_ZCMA.PRE.1
MKATQNRTVSAQVMPTLDIPRVLYISEDQNIYKSVLSKAVGASAAFALSFLIGASNLGALQRRKVRGRTQPHEGVGTR